MAVAGREQARPLVAFLKEQRLNVTLVQDADSAFEEAVLHRPNLVMIHQDLPPSGAFEFCQRLKGNTRTHFLPTIVFASGSAQATRTQAYAAGADAVFAAGDDLDERRARLWALLRTQALFRRHEKKRESQGVALRERGQWLGSFMHDLQNAVGALQANFDFLDPGRPVPARGRADDATARAGGDGQTDRSGRVLPARPTPCCSSWPAVCARCRSTSASNRDGSV